jgi:hypothetical protein
MADKHPANVANCAITADATGDRFLTSSQVRARYGGVSDMWLWRRCHDGSGFPQPMVIRKRRYWSLAQLVAWETAHASRANSAAASMSAPPSPNAAG